MCNAYKMKTSPAEIARLFTDLKAPLLFPEGAPNMEPRDPIRITELAPIIIPASEGPALISRPWSWKGPHGKPVFNFKGEGRRFPVSARCIIPTDGFYEFTTSDDARAKRKDRWLFTVPGEPLFFIAGHMPADAWTMLTVEPGPDVAPFHNRQIVPLRPAPATDCPPPAFDAVPLERMQTYDTAWTKSPQNSNNRWRLQ